MALHVVLCVHLVATLPKLPTPRKAIKASEEEHEQGCSSDKITKQNNLLLKSLCPTVPEETNLEQLLFSLSSKSEGRNVLVN